MKHIISVLIPIYNESKTIQNIVKTIQSCDLVDEIICINDGSTDETDIILKRIKGIKVVKNKTNLGKASAIAKGILQSKGTIIVMIDADLIGLQKNHLDRLIKPLTNEHFDYSIGWTLHGFVDKLIKPLTGERAYFKKDLLPHVEKMRNIGYGLELFLNYNFKNNKGKYVVLESVRHPFKEEKHRLDTAMKLNIHALSDITSIILKSENPPSFLVHAYLPFYLSKKPALMNRLRSQITKMQKLIE